MRTTGCIRGAFVALIMVVLAELPGAAVALSPTAPLASFPTEQSAQAHCPSDTVVWLNLPTGIYHMKGMRWYGRTNSGAFVCQGEADRAGMRETRNGQ